MVVEGIERGEGKRSQRERTNRSRVDRFQKEATPVGEPKDNPIGEIGKSYEFGQKGKKSVSISQAREQKKKETNLLRDEAVPCKVPTAVELHLPTRR